MEDSLKGNVAKAPVITMDDSQLRGHVSGLVRQSVEDTLNADNVRYPQESFLSGVSE